MEPASAFIDNKIKELGDWRGKTLARVREIVHEADPGIVEEWKWAKPEVAGDSRLVPQRHRMYGRDVVKMTFAKGAALQDPSGLFNSSLEGNIRRASGIHEGDMVDEVALKDLIRAAVALNLKGHEQTEAPASEEKSDIPTQAKTGLEWAARPAHEQKTPITGKCLKGMAGTTGLEPAACAVTESQDAVTDWNRVAWIAPYHPVRYALEGLLDA